MKQKQHKEASLSVLFFSRDVVRNIPSVFPSKLACVGSDPFWVVKIQLTDSSQFPNQQLETMSSKTYSPRLLLSCPSPTSARELEGIGCLSVGTNPYPRS